MGDNGIPSEAGWISEVTDKNVFLKYFNPEIRNKAKRSISHLSEKNILSALKK